MLDSESWPGPTTSDFSGTRSMILITAVLRALVPTLRGSILCPKLHNIGISCDANVDISAGWTSESPGWEAWLEEASAREDMPFGLGELWVTEEVVKMDKERRELSQGREPARMTPCERCGQAPKPTPLTPAEVQAKWGKCVALEKIYLRGCIVQENVWKRRQKSPVEAICIPDPLGPAERIPVSKKARITHPWQDPEWD